MSVHIIALIMLYRRQCSIRGRLTIRNIVIPGLKVAINGLYKTPRTESLETKTCHKLHYIVAVRCHLCFINRRNLVTLIVLTVTHIVQSPEPPAIRLTPGLLTAMHMDITRRAINVDISILEPMFME